MADKSLLQQLKNAPKVDALAVGALALNVYAIYMLASIRDIQELLEPFATEEIMLIQVTSAVLVIYLLEFLGDKKDSGTSRYSSSSEKEGLIGWIAGFLEHGSIGTIVDMASLVTVFLGYQYISQNVGRGVSIFEISLTEEVLAMQLSILMMVNFSLYIVGDLMSKSGR